jgi:hypothetical protein
VAPHIVLVSQDLVERAQMAVGAAQRLRLAASLRLLLGRAGRLGREDHVPGGRGAQRKNPLVALDLGAGDISGRHLEQTLR